MPESDIIAFSLEEAPTIIFWDFRKKTILTSMRMPIDSFIINNNALIKTIDFSPDAEWILFTNGTLADIKATTLPIKNHIAQRAFFARYTLLTTCALNTEEPLPRDIISLLIQQLRSVYKL